MPEIERPLIRVGQGDQVRNLTSDPMYVITKDHTIADVCRWIAQQGGEIDARVMLGELAIADVTPLDMVLHCPACGLQHIDAPQFEYTENRAGYSERERVWDNPPHRSHLCAGCGHVWRPADVPTNGVEHVKTHGQNDSPLIRPYLRTAINADELRRKLSGKVASVETLRDVLAEFGVRVTE